MSTAPVQHLFGADVEPALTDLARAQHAVALIDERTERQRLENFDDALVEIEDQVTKLRELAVGDRGAVDRGYFLQEVDEVNDEIQRALRDLAELRKELES